MPTQEAQKHAFVAPVKSYDLNEWQRGYESLKQEFDYWIDDVEGQIPP